MSGRCAVPLCRHQIGGYTFPKDNASRKRWVTAVKRVSGNNKPWSPNSGDYPYYRPALQLYSYKMCSTDTIHSWAPGRFWFGIFFWIWICKTSLYYRHCKVHSSGDPTKHSVYGGTPTSVWVIGNAPGCSCCLHCRGESPILDPLRTRRCQVQLVARRHDFFSSGNSLGRYVPCETGNISSPSYPVREKWGKKNPVLVQYRDTRSYIGPPNFLYWTTV